MARATVPDPLMGILDTRKGGWDINYTWKAKKGGMVLEAYLRSGRDSDGDGIGDLPGLMELLPYFAKLGVELLWLTPFYPSGGYDSGYDVIDPCDIDRVYGTLADFDELVERAGEAGIGIMVDQVVGHVSHLHPWFQEALADPTGPAAERFYFHEPTEGNVEPSNHLSIFGGSCWSMIDDPGSPAYRWWYYHTFHWAQPQLNYHNPEVQFELRRIITFWFERGVKGIRIDAVPYVGPEPYELKQDAPPSPHYREGVDDLRKQFLHPEFTAGMHKVIRIINEVAAQFGGWIIYEAYPTNIFNHGEHADIAKHYFGPNSTAISFALIYANWGAEAWRSCVQAYLDGLTEGGRPLWSLSNHDVSRLASRLGWERALVALATMIMLPGDVLLYHGDETNTPNGPGRTDGVYDPPGTGGFVRGYCRGPVAHTSDPATTFGFTSAAVTPWCRPDPADGRLSVAIQETDARMPLMLARTLMALRRHYQSLSGRHYTWITFPGAGQVFGIMRPLSHRAVLVELANFEGEAATVKLPWALLPAHGTSIIYTSTGKEITHGQNEITLEPYEVLIFRINRGLPKA